MKNDLKREISNLKLEVIKNKNLTNHQKGIINKARIKEWGVKEKKNFSKDYEPETLWFFVKKKNKVVSLGGLRPIKIRYLGKDYNIMGICSIISLEKGKGYGKILISFMIDYAKRTGKTLLGFTTETGFFKKAGLETKKGLTKRFVYLNPKTKEKVYDDEGNGIYYNGKDNFIKKVLSTKSPIYINVLHW